MACNLVLKAPNGQQSKLFRDIVEATTTPDDAINTYFFTKTAAFTEQYQGKLDINGEPIYDDISSGKYVHDVDFAKVELSHSADVFKKLMKTVPKLINKLERRIDYLKYKGDNTHVANLQDILDILQTDAVNQSIPKFFEMSANHITALHAVASEAALKKAATKEDLLVMSGLWKTASSYSVINDLKRMLTDSVEVGNLFSDSFHLLEGAEGKMIDIQNLYLAKNKEFLTEELHKRDSTVSKKNIRKYLDEVPQDVSMAEYQVMYMGDSKDPLLYQAAKILMEAEHTIRREAISFDKKLQEKLENLEASYSGDTSKMFDSIIVEHNDELHVIDPSVLQDSTAELNIKMYNKLQKIKGDKPMMEFLVFYSESMSVLDSGLPEGSVMGTRIPSVTRSDWDLIQGGTLADKRNIIQDNVKNRIMASNLDMEKGQLLDSTGKPVRRIPTFYTQKYNSIEYKKAYDKDYKTQVDLGKNHDDAHDLANASATKTAKAKLVKVLSKDLASSLQSFHSMATNFSAKFEVVHLLESIGDVVGSSSREYGVTAGGKKITDVFTGEQQMKSGEGSMAYKQLMKFYDMQLFGMKQKDHGSFNVMGKDLDWNKTLRGVSAATSAVQIPFNITAGIGNVTYGAYSNIMEAAGREYYSFKSYGTGSKFYVKNLGSTFADIGARTPSSPVNLLEEHYNFLQNYGGNNVNASERLRLKRLVKTDKAYFLTSIGEHLNQVRAGLAMLADLKAYDAKGNEVGSLLDVHTYKDGVLKIKEDTYVKEKDGSIVKYDTLQQNRVSDRIGAVLRKAHGNYSSATAGAAKQDARLSMLVQFRGWAAESIKKRFGKASPNYMLEQNTEGFYISGAKAFYGLAKDIKKFNLDVAKENWSNLSKHEKANIRRFAVEAAMIALTTAASLMFGKMGKEIEDEYDGDNWEDRLALGSFRFAQYQILRLKTEVGAYTNLTEAVKLMRSPAATIGLGESTIKILMQMTDPFEQYDTGYREGQYKLPVKIGKTLPIYKHISAMTPEGLNEKSLWLQ